ncbi:MAG: hypothetical protein J6U21_05435 [Bacteroidales bacterium]|nr:hypothetical protein [Bacteroidales bacterium]
MKNIFFKILPLVAAILFATSCSKDDNSDAPTAPIDNTTAAPSTTEPTQSVVDNGELPSIQFTITVNREEDESLSKATIAGENDLRQLFEDGDQLVISGTDIDGTLDLVSGVGTSSATFSGELKGAGVTKIETDNPELTASLKNEANENDGKALEVPQEFSYNKIVEGFQKYGYLTQTFKYADRNSITLEQRTAFLRFVFGNLYGYNGVKVTITTPDNVVHTVYVDSRDNVAVPNGSKVNAFFFNKEMTINTSATNASGKKTVIYNITRSTFERPSENCFCAAFSVSETEQVLFSTGNLQYGLKTKQFRFAPSQDDMCFKVYPKYNVGENYATALSDGYEYIDLFGWGAWLSNNPAKTDGNQTSDYSWPNDDPHTTMSVDGSDGWYTLTKDEWNYLLFTRETASGVRFVRANVHFKDDNKPVMGLIIFPDNCPVTADQLKKDFFHTESDVANDLSTSSFYELSKNDWENLLVWGDFSLVFLPAAGLRSQSMIWYYNVSDQGWGSIEDTKGYYWSSSISKEDEDMAHHICFEPKSRHVYTSYDFKTFGYSVRLVHGL